MWTSQRYSDQERFRSGIAAASSELTVAGPGRFEGELDRAALPLTHAQRACSNLANVLLAGVMPRAVFHLGLPAAGHVVLNGRPLLPGEIAFCPPSGEVHVRTEAGVAWNTVSFPLPEFAISSQRLLGHPLPAPASLRVVRPPQAVILRLIALRRELLTLRTEIRNSPACETLACSLMESTAMCFDAGTPMPERLSERRAREIIVGVEFLIKETSAAPLNLAQLCSSLGVPARTLNTACRSVLGMSAGHYLRRRRLHAARRELAVGGATVTQAATNQGFWELGRFAASYRAVYGEPPSATARRAGYGQ